MRPKSMTRFGTQILTPTLSIKSLTHPGDQNSQYVGIYKITSWSRWDKQAIGMDVAGEQGGLIWVLANAGPASTYKQTGAGILLLGFYRRLDAVA